MKINESGQSDVMVVMVDQAGPGYQVHEKLH